MKIAARNAMLMVQNGGDEEMYKKLFIGTVERTGNTSGGYLDIATADLSEVGAYAYYYHQQLGAINLPLCTSLKNSAFANTKIYGDITLPMVATIGNRCFSEFYFYGATISIPSVLSLDNQQFYQGLQWGRINTTTRAIVEADNCTSISNRCFYNATGLKRLYAPKLTSISGSDTFLMVGSASSAGNVELVVGSREADTGLTMSALTALSGFPFGASASARVTWYCKDGTVTYSGGTWVQTPYS